MTNSVGAVVIEGLHVVRGGHEVIPDLTTTVQPGQITGLLGPSGCGKSTLMRSIVGVQVVAGGTVLVLGRPAGSASLRRSVGYVTQAPSVYPDLSIRENLEFFAAVLGVDETAVDDAIGTVGLERSVESRVDQLSGGQRSRASLAVALLGSPEVLVLDEPTVGLDPVLRRQLWETFARLAAGGTTIIVSSHVMDEAEHCSRLLLMRDGALLADEAPGALMERTHTRDIESAFLALVEGELAA